MFDCTRGQIEILSSSIAKRKETESLFLAAIHGAEVKKTQENTVDAGDTSKLRQIGIHVVEE